MWEKLRIRERERMLGLLFIGSVFAVLGCVLLAQNFPDAAKVAGYSFPGALCLFILCRLLWFRQNTSGRAPVGPLAPDEKLKARAKLVKAQPQNGLRSS
jgi:hypothetical protein